MTQVTDRAPELGRLYAEMATIHTAPLWEVLGSLVSPAPGNPISAHKWEYGAVREFLLRAGDLISATEAERRVLILENPRLPGASSITSSLYAGLQLILPGEVAPCHRHSQSALRFVMEGSGAYTSVDGERAEMHPYDLILTPAEQWHDHGHEGSTPMIWLDGLDIPIVRHFDTSFAERYENDQFPQMAPPDISQLTYGRNLRPIADSQSDTRKGRCPFFHYPYREWHEALQALRKFAPIDPHLGFALEFINPSDGGPVLPTIAAQVRLIPKGFATRRMRTSDASVVVVVEGEGVVRAGDWESSLSPHDIVVLPSWSEMTFDAKQDLLMFMFSDKAAQMKLGLYREQKL